MERSLYFASVSLELFHVAQPAAYSSLTHIFCNLLLSSTIPYGLIYNPPGQSVHYVQQRTVW